MKKFLTSPWLFILFSLACLLPFFILTAFNHPSADDFTVAYSLKVKSFWEAQFNWYLTWSGRYISTAIVSLLHPLVYKSFFLYRLYPILLLASTWFAIRHLFKSLFPQLRFKALLAASGICTITILSILPSVVQGYYWVPGSLIYMLGNIFTLLFASNLLRFIKSKNCFQFYLFLFFGILAIGSNELNLFIVLGIICIWGLGKFIQDKKLSAQAILSIAILGIASGFSLFAPGNSARGAVIERAKGNEAFVVHDPIFALQNCITHGSSDLLHWAFISPLLILCLLAILKRKELLPNLKPVFHPILIWIFILGLFFFLYFPYYYGTGNPDSIYFPARTSNVICFYLCFALPVGLLYTIEWLSKIKNQTLPIPPSTLFFQGVSTALILILLTTGNIKMALKDLRSRDFLAYHHELNARYDLISNSKADTLVVDSLHFFPRTIYMEDISSDPSNWKNAPYANYFGKKLIRLKNAQDVAERP